MELLKRPVQYLPSLGPRRAELLAKELNIHTFEDLLYYFPYKYIDRSKFYAIRELNDQLPYVQLKGRFTHFEMFGEGASRRYVGTFSDGAGMIELVWFKGIKYVNGKYEVGREYVVFGKPSAFNNRVNMVHPEIEEMEKFNHERVMLQAFYNTTEKMKNNFMTSKALQKVVSSQLALITAEFPETLPADVIQRAKVVPYNQAIRKIHVPLNPQDIRQAEYRLKFEEFFYIQLNLLRQAKLNNSKLGGHTFSRIGHYFNTFYEKRLPFQLTEAQKRVLREMRKDMGSGLQMNRLLQGDVGSGKTIVALMTMLMASDNNYQACLMAPTEILATQHFDSLRTMLEGIGLEIALLTGSTKKKERTRILEGLADGSIHWVVGTHALIEEPVVFHNLGLAVIDEQHRFGVVQRAKIWKKNNIPPHILVMTATPIPRTLAMTIYGDLEVSVIDELPPGRTPIETKHLFEENRGKLYASIRRQLQEGRQIYFVYPLISESEKVDLKNLEEGYQHICEAFPTYQVGMVHGKMKPAEKDAEMSRFISNQTQILVATTVIEVGVNVPNASVMVIESAQRFGLSQLHQLRGRVGRGAAQSYCIFLTPYAIGENTRKRLEIMCSTTDGFEIAEADLRLRGPGDLEGTQQSGDPLNLKIANLVKDSQLLIFAREIAQEVLANDPDLSAPEHRILRERIHSLFGKQISFSIIS